MADRFITRVLAALLAVVVLAICLPASAGLVLDPPDSGASKGVTPIPNATLYRCGYPGGVAPGPWSQSQAASCASFFSANNQPGRIFATVITGDAACGQTVAYTINSTTVTRTTTVVTKASGLPAGYCGRDDTQQIQLLFDTKTANICPDNAAPDDPNNVTACTCGAGYKANAAANACVPDCTTGRVASSGYYDVGAQAGGSPKTIACAGACQVVFDGVSPAGSAMVNGEKHWFAKGSYSATGAGCTPAKQETDKVGEGAAKLPDTSCKPGETAGSINGKTVCYKESGEVTDESKNTASDQVTKTKTTNPDGSVTETEVRTRVDAKGNKETTTTTTTTNPDGSSTTTKTVENPLPGTTLSGDKPTKGDGTSDNTDDGEKGECEKNPSAAGCGGEPVSVSGLYTAKEKTMAGVLAAHRDTFMSSPMGAAAGGFFNVSGGGGCPTFNRRIPFINADVSIDQFCTPFAADALAIFKGALLLCCSFFAFRVAVE